MTPTGTVPLESLSDGFRSAFVIVSDLLLRLSLAAPRPEDILAQEAVCMIDERIVSRCTGDTGVTPAARFPSRLALQEAQSRPRVPRGRGAR